MTRRQLSHDVLSATQSIEAMLTGSNHQSSNSLGAWHNRMPAIESLSESGMVVW